MIGHRPADSGSVDVKLSLGPDAMAMLDGECARTGRSRDELVSDIVRRHVALRRFERLRGEIMPYAERAGFTTDADVFREIS
jgi:hypothetical protein